MWKPKPTEEVKEWIPITPREDGSVRRWVEDQDELDVLVGWLGVSVKNGSIGKALNSASAGEIVQIKPFRFIKVGLGSW